ncbi:hypothetical protein CPB83DRAFT_837080 [Crepidotus variabilis]|uniref:Uncharacterized protein n=1 Tax=Crepidotus variabilis TaxID=179855 RepID=A0A9P6EDG0_9AGAR|nr:hypothetical protein CPB83DRAFT_837080 [Crepidotus variabilis]
MSKVTPQNSAEGRKIPTVIAGDMRCALTKSAVHQVIRLFFWLFAVLMGNLSALQMSPRGITILVAVPTSLISSWSTWCNVRMLEVTGVQDLGGSSEISAHNKMYALCTI